MHIPKIRLLAGAALAAVSLAICSGAQASTLAPAHPSGTHLPRSAALAPILSRPPLTVSARTALPSARHSAFPGATRLQDGRLLVIWREGAQHLSFDGVLYGSTSSDNGATWTPQTVRLAIPGLDLRDPSLAVVGGTVYLTYCTSQAPAAYGNGVYVARSTDGGVTFSTPVRVDGGLPRAGESGRILALADGRLLQTFYGHPAGETRDSVYATTSPDGGQTWATATRVLNGQTRGYDVLEPWSTTTPNGTVRVYVRWGNASQIGSVDFDGTTWSNAHPLFAGSGRPACVPNGADVLCVYRQLDPTGVYRPGIMRLSTDGGKTFGPAQLLDGTTGNAVTMFTYAAPVASGSGWVVPYALQAGTADASTSSQMYVRTVSLGGSRMVRGTR